MTQPSQNAFDLLKCGGLKFNHGLKQAGKRRRASTDQQDKYAVCPVCGLSVPKAFIELHASDCLVRPSQRPTQATPTAIANPAAATAGSGGSAAAGAGSGSRAALSGTTSASAPAAHHQKQQHGGNGGATQQQQQRVPTAKPHPLHSRTVTATDGACIPNAFLIMAAAQAAQVPFEASLFLEARSDGSWACHWWSEGSPCQQHGLAAAWSATVNAVIPKKAQAAAATGSSSNSSGSNKGPDIPNGSTKLRLQVATNLPPGFGAEVDWSNEQLPSNYRPEQQQQQQQQQHSQQVPQEAAGSGDAGGCPVGPAAAAAAAGPAAAAGGGNCSSSSSSKEPLRWRGGVSVPISALQKCIRRGQAASATRLALYLLKEPQSCEALLRRLCVICLEDGLLHPQLPLVVWAMLAVSKGYVVGGSLANALLAITHQMAAVEWRDFLPDADQVRGPAAAIYQAPRTWQAVDALLPPWCPEALLVRSMLIRAAYGGMEGDREMLLRFAGLWLARFSGATQPPPELPQQQQQQQQVAQPPVHSLPQWQQQWQHPGAGPAEGEDQQQQEAQQAQQQQPPLQQQQQQQRAAGVPGRKGPASCEGSAAAGSPWLAFLRTAYQGLWQRLCRLSDPAQVPTASVMLVGPLTREDIPLAAIDFHVAPGLTEHLLGQQQLHAAMRTAAASSTAIAAQLTGLGPASLINSTLWLFRSSYNRKAWLQERYQQQQQQGQQQPSSGYAKQVLAMELEALGGWKAEQRAKRDQLLPLWRVMALLADAWSREHISKRFN